MAADKDHDGLAKARQSRPSGTWHIDPDSDLGSHFDGVFGPIDPVGAPGSGGRATRIWTTPEADAQTVALVTTGWATPPTRCCTSRRMGTRT